MNKLQLKQGQRDRLMAAGRINLRLVQNKIISTHKLGAIGCQPKWLHATLIDQHHQPQDKLTEAGVSAVAHEKEHGDRDAACAHARAGRPRAQGRR